MRKPDKATTETEHSDIKKTRSALRRAAAKKSMTGAMGANPSPPVLVKLESLSSYQDPPTRPAVLIARLTLHS